MFDSDAILAKLRGALVAVVTPDDQLYWLFFASAIGLAFVIYWRRRSQHGGMSLTGFLNYCFPSSVYRHPSALLDFRYFAVNTIVYGVFIAPLLLTSTTTAVATAFVLIRLFGEPASPLLPGGMWADVAVTVAVVVFADIGFFISHYLQHRIGWLWEFHKVHHSAEVLHPIAQYRRHPLDGALDAVLMGSLAGLVLGLSGFMFDESVKGITILGANAVLFVFNFAGVHLRHSHVGFSFGWLDRILISPILHQIHHGSSPLHIDKNFGGIFSIWDRLAGTLCLPRDDEELVLGLHDGEHRQYNSIIRLYMLPFAKIAHRALRFSG